MQSAHFSIRRFDNPTYQFGCCPAVPAADRRPTRCRSWSRTEPRFHTGDLDPGRPGLEVFQVHEDKNAKYGLSFRDAATGKILWGVYAGKDVGRGMAADIDPR